MGAEVEGYHNTIFTWYFYSFIIDWKSELSDIWTFGHMNVRTDELSDSWAFWQMNGHQSNKGKKKIADNCAF